MVRPRLKEQVEGSESIRNVRRSSDLKGSVWSKYAEQRFKEIVGDSKIMSPGPGHYKPEVEDKPLERHPSSSFVSNSARSYLDNIVYETNQDAKAQLRDRINFKSDKPGPGQYQFEVPQDRRSNKFQFFGSTEERLLPSPQAHEEQRAQPHPKSLALKRLAARMLNPHQSSDVSADSSKLEMRIGESSVSGGSIHVAHSLQTIDTTVPAHPSIPKNRSKKTHSVQNNHKPTSTQINMIFDQNNLF